jgi:hypothetical protein
VSLRCFFFNKGSRELVGVPALPKSDQVGKPCRGLQLSDAPAPLTSASSQLRSYFDLFRLTPNLHVCGCTG